MRYLGIVLLLYWIVLTERVTVESFIIGCLISFAVSYFFRSSKSNSRESKYLSIKILKLWTIYIAKLLKEVVVSNIHVAKIVLSPSLRISPSIVKRKIHIKSDINKAIFANSITLTPGTITIVLEKEEILVHCLDNDSANGVQESELEKIIMKAEEK